MAFKVELSEKAERDIVDAYEFIAKDSAKRAKIWFEKLFDAMENLKEHPLSFEKIPESKILKRELRSIIHHSHRVIYEFKQRKKSFSSFVFTMGPEGPLVDEICSVCRA